MRMGLMAVVSSITMGIPTINVLFIAVHVAMVVVRIWVTEHRGENDDKYVGVGGDEHDYDADGCRRGDEDDDGVD